MRQLNGALHRAQRGMTLIELMVTVAIAGILLVQGLPAYADYLANSRLREGANLILTGTLLARNEAIKRNHQVTVDIVGQRLVVSQVDASASGAASPTTTLLRTTELPARLSTSTLAATFDSTGRPFPFGTDITVTVSAADRPGAADLRCPKVHIEAGGTVNLIRDGACP